MILCTVDFLLYRESHLFPQTVFNSEIAHSRSNKTEFEKSATNIVAFFGISGRITKNFQTFSLEVKLWIL